MKQLRLSLFSFACFFLLAAPSFSTSNNTVEVEVLQDTIKINKENKETLSVSQFDLSDDKKADAKKTDNKKSKKSKGALMPPPPSKTSQDATNKQDEAEIEELQKKVDEGKKKQEQQMKELEELRKLIQELSKEAK